MGISALSVAFVIISFAFVNHELCHVLCDEAKSCLCHLYFHRRSGHKVSNNETVFLLEKKNL